MTDFNLEDALNGKLGVGVVEITVTPELAISFLATRNRHNRGLTEARIAKYSTSMLAGEWASSPAEPLAFDCEGQILNAQHRLHSVVRANVAVKMWIAYGLDKSLMKHIDQGKSRSVSDFLSMNGVAQHLRVAAICRTTLQYEHSGDRVWAGTQLVNAGITQAMEQDEALDPIYVNATRRARGAVEASGGILNANALGAFLVLIGRHSGHEDRVEEFLVSLASGSNLELGNPILALRSQWIRESRERQPGSGQWVKQRRLGMLIRAWNAWICGKEVRLIKFTERSLPMEAVA